jgi:hypothetical protein
MIIVDELINQYRKKINYKFKNFRKFTQISDLLCRREYIQKHFLSPPFSLS